MRSRSLIIASFALLAVQAAFALPCTNGSNLSDGHGGDLTQFSCTFTPSGPNSTTVFNLTSYIENGLGTTDNYENWMTPGYVVFTSDTGNLSDTASWVYVLYFVPDQIADGTVGGGDDGSDTVDLYTGAAMPSYSTVNNFGSLNFGTGIEAVGGTYTASADSVGGNICNTNTTGPANYHSCTDAADSDVHSYAVTNVPEPCSLLLVLSAGLGALVLRRRAL